MLKTTLIISVGIAMLLLLWMSPWKSTYSYKASEVELATVDRGPEKSIDNASIAGPSDSARWTNVQDLDESSIPQHVKACISFWAGMGWDYAKAVVAPETGQVICEVEVDHMDAVPNKVAYGDIEREAKSLGIPIRSLKASDINRVLSWRHKTKSYDSIKEIAWQGRLDCIENPHQSICRLRYDDPALPKIDEMPSDFKVPGWSD